MKKVIDGKLFKKKFETSRFKSSKKLAEIVDAISNGEDFKEQLSGLSKTEISFLNILRTTSLVIVSDDKTTKSEKVSDLISSKKTSSKKKKSKEDEKLEESDEKASFVEPEHKSEQINDDNLYIGE